MSTGLDALTLEAFLLRPEREDDQREELIEGELVVSPRGQSITCCNCWPSARESWSVGTAGLRP